jgi:hypothetical protein
MTALLDSAALDRADDTLAHLLSAEFMKLRATSAGVALSHWFHRVHGGGADD